MTALVAMSLLGVLAMVAELLRLRKIIGFCVGLGLAVVVVLAIGDLGSSWIPAIMKDALVFDNAVDIASALLAGIALFWFLLAGNAYVRSNPSDLAALVCFSLSGAITMVAANSLVMLFLGIEMLSIPLYVLAGSERHRFSSNEAALKYFLMGAFASAFLLFGIALVYGAAGAFGYPDIAAYVESAKPASPMFVAGIVLIFTGLAFKASLVPFHFWAPDVYEGAPTPVTAFMATVVKIAAFVTLYRFFDLCRISETGNVWPGFVSSVALLSLIVGNVLAFAQTNVKRMLAYSSISHAGFLAMSLLAVGSGTGQRALLFYAAVYAVATLTALYIVHRVGIGRGSESIDAFDGLARQDSAAGFALTTALFSLAGIPPLAGFFAKYMMFSIAIERGAWGLAIAAVLASLLGVGYYFKIVIAMYGRSSEHTAIPVLFGLTRSVVLLLSVLLIVLGFFPDLFAALA